MSAANKPSRNRNPSRKVADDANSEAPSAAHQEVLATKPVLDLIKSITKLSAQLPETDTVAAAFTRRFDVLFGNDCRGADGLFTNIRRGDRGTTAVVVYLQSIYWASAQIPLDLAVKRLTALDTNLHIICAAAAKPAKKSKRVDKPDQTPDHLVEQATEKQNDLPKAGMKGPHWEQRMDQIFTAAIKPSKKAKNADLGDGSDSDGTDYRPRKPRAVSEESQDDFEVNEVGKAAPEGGKKRKLIVLDDEDSGAEEKSKSKSKKKLGRPRKKARQAPEGAALPKISVIELDDTDDEATAQTKKGPANTSRDHLHPPVAVSNNLGKPWEFKCRHCTSSLTVKQTVSRKATFEDEKPQPAIGNLATYLLLAYEKNKCALSAVLRRALAPARVRLEVHSAAAQGTLGEHWGASILIALFKVPAFQGRRGQEHESEDSEERQGGRTVNIVFTSLAVVRQRVFDRVIVLSFALVFVLVLTRGTGGGRRQSSGAENVDARAGGVDGGDENLGIRAGSSTRERDAVPVYRSKDVATLAEYTAICETSAVISELSETRDSKGGYSHNGVGLMLCDFEADVDLSDNKGNTPLHYASSWGHIPLLIERGCQHALKNKVHAFRLRVFVRLVQRTLSKTPYGYNTKIVKQDLSWNEPYCPMAHATHAALPQSIILNFEFAAESRPPSQCAQFAEPPLLATDNSSTPTAARRLAFHLLSKSHLSKGMDPPHHRRGISATSVLVALATSTIFSIADSDVGTHSNNENTYLGKNGVTWVLWFGGVGKIFGALLLSPTPTEGAMRRHLGEMMVLREDASPRMYRMSVP
ncbi:hypothetical protein K438DRAFT_1768179 [Mycena galopus ATCC 62051]|nr:hypothetical protein K438DRAFT_1768179 [Mycena galopus ATCC 62051]